MHECTQLVPVTPKETETEGWPEYSVPSVEAPVKGKMSLADQACASGLESMKNGDLDSAEEYFKEALNRKFDHPKTRYYYGACAVSVRGRGSVRRFAFSVVA